VLAFDHDVILVDAIERVRAKFEYTTVATSLVTEPFTVPELRRVYESVWGVNLHPANFRRKVMATPGFVVPLASAIGDGIDGGERRGPDLFRRGTAALLHPAMLRPAPTDE
jgi:8-oxo-dGTP diphosphatase